MIVALLFILSVVSITNGAVCATATGNMLVNGDMEYNGGGPQLGFPDTPGMGWSNLNDNNYIETNSGDIYGVTGYNGNNWRGTMKRNCFMHVTL
jgi:hypothetical protein